MFGELTENLTRHRNELLKKARSLDTVSCAWTRPLPGQQTVDACACSKTVARSPFCTSDMLPLCQLAYTWLIVTLLLKLPSQTRIMGVSTMFPGTYVPRYRCSPNLYSPVPMFPGTYVPRYRCSPIFVL